MLGTGIPAHAWLLFNKMCLLFFIVYTQISFLVKLTKHRYVQEINGCFLQGICDLSGHYTDIFSFLLKKFYVLKTKLLILWNL